MKTINLKVLINVVITKKYQVNQSLYRPGEVLRVPGG
jgi:hypothetical protein